MILNCTSKAILRRWLLIAAAGILVLICCLVVSADEKTQLDYAKGLLDSAGKGAELRLVKELGHPEAFRIEIKDGRTVIEADSPAGLIYGAQAVVCNEAQAGQVQQPDFDVRGTTLWMAGAVSGKKIAPYHAQLNAERFPWFFDRTFMTRYLDALASARYNTLFLWASHPFPHILELPKYPGATDLTPEQLKQNQGYD